jgi:hypothetical protein
MGVEIDEHSTLAAGPAKLHPVACQTARCSADSQWVHNQPVNRDLSCSPGQYVHPHIAKPPRDREFFRKIFYIRNSMLLAKQGLQPRADKPVTR